MKKRNISLEASIQVTYYPTYGLMSTVQLLQLQIAFQIFMCLHCTFSSRGIVSIRLTLIFAETNFRSCYEIIFSKLKMIQLYHSVAPLHQQQVSTSINQIDSVHHQTIQINRFSHTHAQ